MARRDHYISNLSAGVISPRLRGRIDLRKYFDALETGENMLVLATGGGVRRPGTRHVTNVLSAGGSAVGVARLFPFEFSAGNNLMLLFFEFFGGGVVGYVFEDGALAFPGLNPPGFALSPTYSPDQLFDIKFVQSADILYLFHPNVAPQELQRTGPSNQQASWNLVPFESGDGPYSPQNTIASKTLQPSATSGVGITITGVGVSFNVGDIGRKIRLQHVGIWGYVVITGITSPTVITADVKATLGGTTAVSTWRGGAWGGSSGFPRTGTFWQERLWIGGTTFEPQTVWSSNSGDFNEFRPSDPDGTVTDDQSITRTISDDRVNVIQRLVSTQRGLMVGTSGGLFLINAGALNDVATPDNAVVNRISSRTMHGRARVVIEDLPILYVENGGRFVQALAFNVDADGLSSSPVSTLVDHLMEEEIVDLVSQSRPNRIVWALTATGRLYSLTFEPQDNIAAWMTHRLGGNFAGGPPIIESIATLFNGINDELWLLVKRTVNGTTVRHVELLAKVFDTLDNKDDAYYLDDGLTLTNSPATTAWSGVAHLEGETASVVADGAVDADVTIVGSAFTTTLATSTVHVGYHHASEITPVPLEVPIDAGVSIGKVKNVHKVHIYVHRSGTFRIGQKGATLDRVFLHDGGANLGESVPLVTDLLSRTIDFNGAVIAQLTIRQDLPLPLDILSLAVDMGIDDS